MTDLRGIGQLGASWLLEQSGYETTTDTYDGDGNVTKVSAPASSTGGADQVTVSVYNAANELASQTEGYGTAAASTTTYCYDPDGDATVPSAGWCRR